MENDSTTAKPSAISVGLKFGVLLGFASILISVALISFGVNPLIQDWKKSVFGILVTIALVVLAHKNFKDGGDGFMTYGQGFFITFITMMISVLVSGLFTYILVSFIDTSVMDGMYQKMTEDMEAKGSNQEQIDMALMWTKKLFWIMFVVVSVFISAVISLLIPIFTQKKNPEATPFD